MDEHQSPRSTIFSNYESEFDSSESNAGNITATLRHSTSSNFDDSKSTESLTASLRRSVSESGSQSASMDFTITSEDNFNVRRQTDRRRNPRMIPDRGSEMFNNDSSASHVVNEGSQGEVDGNVFFHESTTEEDLYEEFSDSTFEYEPLGADNFSFQNKNLLELLQDINFNQIIDARLNVTKIEMLLAILKFIQVFHLSNDASVNLCKMINSFFNTKVVPDTHYFLDKYFYPKSSIEYHAVCPTCKNYVANFSDKQRQIFCNVCQKNINLKDPSYRDYFAVMDIKSEIQYLIEENAEYYKTIISGKDMAENNTFKDIHNGLCYERCLSSLQGDDRSSYMTATFNSDGSPVFKSSKCAVWPIQIILNEIPVICRESPIIFALWFGRDKPNMTTFLSPFVKRMNEYSQKGIPCKIENEVKYIKLYPLCCCVDSVARAPMQGLVQFNGFYGCNWCLHPGKSVRHGRGFARKYPIPTEDEQEPELRTEHGTLMHLQEALTLRSSVCGVTSASPLLNLHKFHIINGFVPDSMHCVSLGVVKQFTNYWLNSRQKDYSLTKNDKEAIDRRIDSFKVPSYFARLSRSIKDIKYWKAREWENWLLFYSLPLLEQTATENVRFRPYVEHWQYLVESLHILMKDCLCVEDIRIASRYLRQFVASTQMYYSDDAMSYNVHQLLHLSQSVANWGPLWAHNGYFFESGNGEIVKNINAAKGVISQICRNTCRKQNLRILEKHVIINYERSSVLNFCSRLKNKYTDQSIKLNDCRYFGAPTTSNNIVFEEVNLSLDTKVFHRMLKDNCLYQTVKKSLYRANNTFAVTDRGDYVRLLEFLVDCENNKEITVCNKVVVRNIFSDICKSIKIIQNIENNVTLIDTNLIKKICIYMKVCDREYICYPPTNVMYS